MAHIKDIQIGSNTYLIEPVLFATCSTAASTAAKTASITNFALDTGVTVYIKFENENTALSPTLNISSTGAKSINLINGNASLWNANEVVSLTYDGTSWNIDNYNRIEVVRL